MRGATITSRNEWSNVKSILADDSVTFVVGDLVTVNSDGHVALVTNSDEKIAGVVVGFVGKNGQHVDYASGYNDRITTTADNTTVAMVKIQIDCGRELEFIMDADDVLAQTNLFQYFNTNNSYQVDVADASDSNGALQLIQLDPEGTGDASMGTYRIADHQFGHLDS